MPEGWDSFGILEYLIIYKMYSASYIGGRHTSEDNIPKGFPKHMRGEVKKALESLIKKGVIIRKPTSYGNQVMINPRYPNIQRIMEQSVEVVKEFQRQKQKKKSRGLEL